MAKQDRSNLRITLLLYSFILSSSLCRGSTFAELPGPLIEALESKVDPPTHRPEKVSTSPDIISSHAVHTTNAPLSPNEKVSTLPDIVGSHAGNGSGSQVMQPPQMENSFEAVYKLASAAFTPILRSRQLFLALISKIKSDEELVALKKVLERTFEEKLSNYTYFLALTKELEGEESFKQDVGAEIVKIIHANQNELSEYRALKTLLAVREYNNNQISITKSPNLSRSSSRYRTNCRRSQK
ncbi:hypothetical protein [Cardinium endosymbiont of Philonthus spinipes]|uniref:hypothetical protein n=1 Tax=Cardinium endosymbiont of Philonthus spinipes TaxID=3077941 RepID=UPI00313DCDD9